MPLAWTLGYAGHTPESFLEALRRHRIGLLVDVRELALSRKKGFSKGPLSAMLEQADIAYRNDRELGAPRVLRHEVKQDVPGLGEAFRSGYLAHLGRHPEALRRIAADAAAQRVALMCVEADPTDCHRGLLAQRLGELGVEVRHLPGAGTGAKTGAGHAMGPGKGRTNQKGSRKGSRKGTGEGKAGGKGEGKAGGKGEGGRGRNARLDVT